MSKSAKFLIGALITSSMFVSYPGLASAQVGVTPSTIKFRPSRHLSSLQPSRVVVVTTFNQLDRLPEQDVFAESVAASMSSCLGIQVSNLDARYCKELMPHHSGVFDELFLIEMHRKHAADAVLYCEVLAYDAYAPSSMRAHLLMVDTRESVALMECEINLDLNCTGVRHSFQQFIGSSVGLGADGLPISTPTRYLDYCARVAISEMVRRF